MKSSMRHFPDNRLTGDTVLRQAQLVMLRILTIVDTLCKKHKIRYWLDGGTALGAVRHKGFIPWDDDLDICMLRDDYDLFLTIARKELPSNIFLQEIQKDNDYCLHWSKIRDKYSTLTEAAYEKSRFHKGIGIDIFPCDFCPKSRFLKNLEKTIAKAFRYRGKNLHSGMGFREKLTFLASKLICWLVPLKIETRIFSFILKNSKKNSKNIGYGIGTPFTGSFEYSTVFPLKYLEFEGSLFPVPHSVKAYLSELYGDYNQLPDPTHQKGHAILIDPCHPCKHRDVL